LSLERNVRRRRRRRRKLKAKAGTAAKQEQTNIVKVTRLECGVK
jgi:hypothetical protein